MCRHINFRQNSYEPVFGILNKFPDIILCIESSIVAWFIISGRRKTSEVTNLLYIPCTNFSKFWKTFYFNSPAFIISEVQV